MRDVPRSHDPNLLVGTETFDDAGVYQVAPGLAIVQTIDFFPPLVDDPYVYGQIAAANSLSDIYAMGGVPKTALSLVGFPDDKLDLEILGQILRGGTDKVHEAGAVIVGGHSVRDTEIKFGLAVTGLIDPQRIFTNAAARPGDRLVLTKPLGTGFVTTANKAEQCPKDVLDFACRSMTQLNRVAAEAMIAAAAHSATDITGFGLAGHAYGMAAGSGVTIVLELGKLPLIPGIEALVRGGFFTRATKTNRQYVADHVREEPGLDPIRLELVYDAQTSGGLLISLPADRTGELVERLQSGGATCAAVVGQVELRGDASLVIRP